MIDDPPPPDMGKDIGGVYFDYVSTIMKGPAKAHKSDGSVWMDVAQRAFHLRGEAKHTMIGPFRMDLLARGAKDSDNKVYANIKLGAQNEQQCVAYDYPEDSGTADAPLGLVWAAKGSMWFSAIDEIDGEDCGIFVARLSRGREIHIWVDLEGEQPEAILRSEVRRNGKMLRRTDVLKWHLDAVPVAIDSQLRPEPAWNCGPEHSGGKLAHLGLSSVHKRSMELQDALYALRKLPRHFAVLEVLALTGDVAVMVEEPSDPALEQLQGTSFDYKMKVTPIGGAADTVVSTSGHFAANYQGENSIMLSGASETTAVTIVLRRNLMYVRLRAPFNSCLTLPFDESLNKLGEVSNAQRVRGMKRNSAGVFEGMEEAGATECNRFSFLGTGPNDHSVSLWYSVDKNATQKWRYSFLMRRARLSEEG
jgi:hypothetical protein